ncbi:MAG: hypothetical protein NHB32_12010 [Fischerella sp. CENA71]|nr:hypothetical protein [Fischerella sp. CENA71]
MYTTTYTSVYRMPSKVISFRLSEVEIQALSALQTSEDESLNQTAARLLRNILGTSTVSSQASMSVDIREIVRQEVEAIALSTPSIVMDMREMVKQEVEVAISELSRVGSGEQ